MRRREFIALTAGAAAAWPLAARAQQPATPVLGYLSARSPDDASGALTAFRQGLAETGFVEGQNVTIEFRWAHGEYDRLPALAAELVHLPVALLVATGGEPAALAAKAATSTTPIVFMIGNDPITAGLVASYNRPGGNVTGVNILTATLEAKRIVLLHELVPQADPVAFLLNPNNPVADGQLADAQEAARTIALQLHVLRANNDLEIDTAFAIIGQRRIRALAVAAAPFFDTRRGKLVALAAQGSVPTAYHFREYAVAGGLMSYGIDLVHVTRQVGVYAGRILKGAKPADLPVLEPTKFELVINLKTVKALGLTVPPTLLARSDEVIE
jgi:putative ABC transport system substrate-binding protein